MTTLDAHGFDLRYIAGARLGQINAAGRIFAVYESAMPGWLLVRPMIASGGTLVEGTIEVAIREAEFVDNWQDRLY